jgi:hypothetical protein
MSSLTPEAKRIHDLQTHCEHREREFVGAQIGNDGDNTKKIDVEICCNCGLEIRRALGDEGY